MGEWLDSDNQQKSASALAQGNVDAVNAASQPIQDAWKTQQGYFQPIADKATGAYQNYSDAVNDPYFKSDPTKFDDSKYQMGNINEYLDPSMKFRMGQGVAGLDASAAAQGGLFSSGQGRGVTAFAQGLGSEEYGKAFDKMQGLRNNAYQQYGDFLNNQFNRRQARVSGTAGAAGMAMSGLQDLSQQRTAYDQSNIQNLMDQKTAGAQQTASYYANKGAGTRGMFNMLGGLEGDAAGMAGSYLGGMGMGDRRAHV